ncbi:MAG: succinylglutamate desuccinylase/aspartoacylase family protein [Aridibacter sp.]
MEILQQEIKADKRNLLELKVASLYTRTEIVVPVIVEKAKEEGSTILIMGGIHGDEVNGIEIVRRLLFNKFTKPNCGTIICIPIVNVMAFLNMNRKFADGRDLNRSFPGTLKGSLASQLANSLTRKILPHADYVIDLHTGAEQRFNYPQIRYDLNHEDNLNLAKAFNAPFTLLQNKVPNGSLRRVLNDSKTPVILFEGGKSRIITEEVVETGVQGVLNVLDYLNIRKLEKPLDSVEKTKFLHNNRWLRAKASGMFQPVTKNGSFVKEGELLGYINGPYAQFHRKIKSPMDGYIFCVNRSSVVNLGEAIFHIGEERINEKPTNSFENPSVS